MAVATDTRAVGEAAAIAIGGTVGLDAMFGGPDHRRVDEPGALARPGDRRRRLHRDLGLPRRADRSARRVAALAYQFLRGGTTRAEGPPPRPWAEREPRPLRLHPERRALADAPRRCSRAPPTDATRPARPGVARPTHVHPEVVEVMRELGIDLSEQTPHKLDDERHALGRRRRHDGLRRRVPVHPRQALHRLGARRSRAANPSSGCARCATRSAARGRGWSASSPSWSQPARRSESSSEPRVPLGSGTTGTSARGS